MEYLKFKDLIFVPEIGSGESRAGIKDVNAALCVFQNKYAVYVKTRTFNEFWLTILRQINGNQYDLAFDLQTHNTFNPDITKEKVEQLMLEVQQLPKAEFKDTLKLNNDTGVFIEGERIDVADSKGSSCSVVTFYDTDMNITQEFKSGYLNNSVDKD